MDEKSTPISSLNNKADESEVVNQILNKYNNLFLILIHCIL